MPIDSWDEVWGAAFVCPTKSKQVESTTSIVSIDQQNFDMFTSATKRLTIRDSGWHDSTPLKTKPRGPRACSLPQLNAVSFGDTLLLRLGDFDLFKEGFV